jgi:hypothetical protein
MIYAMNSLIRRGRRFAVILALSACYLMPISTARADEEKGPTEARLENYPNKVTLEDSGTALTWVTFLVLAGLTIGVMFKNANRSHLD